MVEASFRVRDYNDKTIDLQVMIKMALWFVTFAFSIWLYRLWTRKLFRIDNVFQVLLLLLIVISCFYSPNMFYSLGAAFSLITIIFLLLLSSSILSNREIARQIIFGGTLVAFLSIIAYFAVPDFGHAKIWVGANHVLSNRLAGICGSANTVGYIAAICLLTLYYYRQYLDRLPAIYWIFVAIDLAALLMSNSRTSMVAMTLAIAVASLAKPTPARLALFFFSVVGVILFFSLVNIQTLATAVSRSGNTEEIATGTGRTAIWSAVIRLIEQRPFFGWGYSSSNFLIPAASGEIGFTVNQAHNAMLEVALSVGLVGLFFFVGLLAMKIFYSFKSAEQLNVALITFLMIDGLTESVAIQGIASTSTIIFATVLALNYNDKRLPRRVEADRPVATGVPALSVKNLAICLVALTALLSAGAASAATYTVQPGQSIQQAVDAAKAGDTIAVEAGQYIERVQVKISGITLKAKGTAVTQGFALRADNVVIDGFEVSNQSTDWPDKFGIFVRGHGNRVVNNYVHDTWSDGIAIAGVTPTDAATSDNIIRGNKIVRAQMSGISVQGQDNIVEDNNISHTLQHPAGRPPVAKDDADGIRYFGSGHIIRNNTIHNIEYDYGSDPNATPHTDCFQTWGPAANITFEHNVCRWPVIAHDKAGGNQSGMVEDLNGPVSNLVFRNNIFSNSYGGINIYGRKAPVTGVVFEHNHWDHVATEAIVLNNAPGAHIAGNVFHEVGGGKDSYLSLDAPSGDAVLEDNNFFMDQGKKTGTWPRDYPHVQTN